MCTIIKKINVGTQRNCKHTSKEGNVLFNDAQTHFEYKILPLSAN